MVCCGPEPPDNGEHDLTPPPTHQLHNDSESDDDSMEYDGYQHLSQGPDEVLNAIDSSDEEIEVGAWNTSEAVGTETPCDVPSVETVDREIIREIWSTSIAEDTIQMDKEKAEQVMSAMASFVLPISSIPDWAKLLPEDQWKQQLHEKIDSIKNRR